MTYYKTFDPDTPDDEGVCGKCGSRNLATLEEGVAIASVPFKLDPDTKEILPDFGDPRYTGWDGPDEMTTIGEYCRDCYAERIQKDGDPPFIITAAQWRRRTSTPTARSTWGAPT